MIHLIDRVDGRDLGKSIVKPEAIRKVLLVQDAEARDTLCALLMVDDRRAVIVLPGTLSLASSDTGMRHLQGFRNELYKMGTSSKELRFCQPGACERALADDRFDPNWFVPSGFPDLGERFISWRAGKATW